MGAKLSRSMKKNKKEIISKKCLLAILDCIAYLNQHANTFGLFHHFGSRNRSRDILARLERGDRDLTRVLNLFGGPLETASALKMFLINLKSPLMPPRVQELVVADNSGVSSRTVAVDALGLLRQEVTGRHMELLLAVLGLLHRVATSSTPSELDGSQAALCMLPVFFTFTIDILPHWRRIAAVFNEILLSTPALSDDVFLESASARTLTEHPSGDLLPQNNPQIILEWRRRFQNEVEPSSSAPRRNTINVDTTEGTRPPFSRVFSRGRLHPLLRHSSPTDSDNSEECDPQLVRRLRRQIRSVSAPR